MKFPVLSSHFSVFSLIAVTLIGHAEETPVPLPPPETYAVLWERSVFTTKDLPAPEAPTGPIFSDHLSLSGIYEVDGSVVAILIDRTTSQFSEARIGSENEQGIKIRKVQPGASMDKTRVQLQKGDIAGWVSFGDVTPAETIAPAIPVQKGAPAMNAPGGVVSPLLPSLQGEVGMAGQAPVPPPSQAVQPQSVRPSVNDVPLPPP
jgi:hypothetical protein